MHVCISTIDSREKKDACGACCSWWCPIYYVKPRTRASLSNELWWFLQILPRQFYKTWSCVPLGGCFSLHFLIDLSPPPCSLCIGVALSLTGHLSHPGPPSSRCLFVSLSEDTPLPGQEVTGAELSVAVFKWRVLPLHQGALSPAAGRVLPYFLGPLCHFSAGISEEDSMPSAIFSLWQGKRSWTNSIELFIERRLRWS